MQGLAADQVPAAARSSAPAPPAPGVLDERLPPDARGRRRETPRLPAAWSWESLREAMQEPQRRWSAGLAAAALIVGAARRGRWSARAGARREQSPPRRAAAAAVRRTSRWTSPSLVQAHTESAARQPLADADRQNMIAMDDSFTADDNGPEAAANAPDAVQRCGPVVCRTGRAAVAGSWRSPLAVAAARRAAAAVRRRASSPASRPPPTFTTAPCDADDHFSYRGRQVTNYWRSGPPHRRDRLPPRPGPAPPGLPRPRTPAGPEVPRPMGGRSGSTTPASA